MELNQEYQIVIRSPHRGDSVANLDFFTKAWDECVELQCQPKEIWVGRSLVALREIERFEIAMFYGGECVGGLILGHDPWDAHVGDCVSVFAQYVLPEFRNKGVSPALMREAIRIARMNKYKVMAFTHRKGPWRYATIYRRIK